MYGGVIIRENLIKASFIIGIILVVLSPTLGSGMADNFVRVYGSFDVNYYVMMVYNFSSMLRFIGGILMVPTLFKKFLKKMENV